MLRRGYFAAICSAHDGREGLARLLRLGTLRKPTMRCFVRTQLGVYAAKRFENILAEVEWRGRGELGSQMRGGAQ